MNKIVIFAMLVLVFLSGCINSTKDLNTQDNKDLDVNEDDKLFCTMDAKACDDGSYVGRDPKNNCEFQTCPIVEVVSKENSTQTTPDLDLDKLEKDLEESLSELEGFDELFKDED